MGFFKEDCLVLVLGFIEYEVYLDILSADTAAGVRWAESESKFPGPCLD